MENTKCSKCLLCAVPTSFLVKMAQQFRIAQKYMWEVGGVVFIFYDAAVALRSFIWVRWPFTLLAAILILLIRIMDVLYACVCINISTRSLPSSWQCITSNKVYVEALCIWTEWEFHLSSHRWPKRIHGARIWWIHVNRICKSGPVDMIIICASVRIAWSWPSQPDLLYLFAFSRSHSASNRNTKINAEMHSHTNIHKSPNHLIIIMQETIYIKH